jgi:uncharacterized membrane protein YphA (DoxX/SURF4 family)
VADAQLRREDGARAAGVAPVLPFEKDLAIAGGLLVLFAFGPGRFSIEGSKSGRALV